MWFEWMMDDELWQADVEPFLRLAVFLRLRLPAPHYRGIGTFVLVDNRIVDADLLPMFQIGGKTVQTVDGFLRSPTGKLLEREFSAAFGPPCPVCFPTRAFLGHHAREIVTQNRARKLENILSWVPCYCGQDRELLRFLLNHPERERR